jgi:hypothetical protein
VLRYYCILGNETLEYNAVLYYLQLFADSHTRVLSKKGKRTWQEILVHPRHVLSTVVRLSSDMMVTVMRPTIDLIVVCYAACQYLVKALTGKTFTVQVESPSITSAAILLLTSPQLLFSL